MDELSALQASGLFGDAPTRDLERLRPALRRRTLARGAYLWHADDPTGLAMVVLNGLVKTCHTGRGGRELVISIAGPMEIVGGYHLFAVDSRRSYDAVAVERTECLVIARDMLMYQLESDPRLMRRLAASLLSKIISEAGAALETPAAGDLRARLAHWLLELARRHGERVDEGLRIPFALPQSLLAGLAGSSREKTNRALAHLAEEGLISRDAVGRLTLLRPEALRRSVG